MDVGFDGLLVERAVREAVETEDVQIALAQPLREALQSI
jgi:hypothetical protein